MVSLAKIREINNIFKLTNYKVDKSIDFIKLPVSESSININPVKFDYGYRTHGGKGQSTTQAICSSIGEALERYNAQYFKNEVTKFDSFNNLKVNNITCINPREFCLDSYSAIKYYDDLRIEWNKVTRLSDNKKVLVPANFVYFVYKPANVSQNFVSQDTTGLASGLTLEEAILQGIEEVIERDAYTIYFRKQLKSMDIDIESIKDKKIIALIKKLKDNGIIVHLKYLKTDISSFVIHCVMEDTNRNFPIYTHGAGSSLNVYLAISRAITECIQLRVSQIKIGNNIEHFKNDKEYDAYISWGKGQKEKIGTLLSKWKEIDCDEFPDLTTGNILNDIKFLVKDFKRVGYEIYVANMSRQDTPIKTVRVLIPGFQPADETIRRVTKRMDSIPKLLKQQNNHQLFNEVLFL